MPAAIAKNVAMSLLTAATLLLAGCAGTSRGCASCNAENFGADWIVVQYRMDGSPVNCWQLRSTSIVNEPHSDGIYWQTPNGHLVHVSGWYNRVQVIGSFESAAKEVGVDLASCPGGRYEAVRKTTPEPGKGSQ